MSKIKKKELENVTYKDLEALLHGKVKLEVNINVDELGDFQQTMRLNELLGILHTIKRALWLNFTNDKLREYTGKDRDNLSNLSLKDIKLFIEKLIELKDYETALVFARVYIATTRYFKE